MTNTSIYNEYYQGTTYRTGVAYLRARSRHNPKAPRTVGRDTLDQQRQIIAEAAREQQTIIVAEFIDYGNLPEYRPGLDALLDFVTMTHAQDCYIVSDRYLTTRAKEIDVWMNYFNTTDLHRTVVCED